MAGVVPMTSGSPRTVRLAVVAVIAARAPRKRRVETSANDPTIGASPGSYLLARRLSSADGLYESFRTGPRPEQRRLCRLHRQRLVRAGADGYDFPDVVGFRLQHGRRH